MQVLGKNTKDITIHFIGVGGTGMSALAEAMATLGAKVSGSDAGGKPADMARLKKAGIKLFAGHVAGNIPAGAMVVTGTAILADNPELKQAQAMGLPILHRAELLAALMQNYQTVAVSGTHGKTSTTALIYTALAAAGADVGILNGGVVNSLQSNVKLPKKASGWLVVEADESDASFLKLKPTIAVITNIEAEHMATYGTEEKLVQAFVDFADSADMAVLCADDANVNIVETRTGSDVLTYGLEEGADVYTTEYTYSRKGMVFDAHVRGGVLDDVTVAMPGVHFVQNALAALAVATVALANDAEAVVKAAEGLAGYQGVARRFTKLGQWHGADVIDDYGHHPTEIAATLDAAKNMYAGKVVAVIQPHRYSRLKDLMDEFATCAKVADAAIILPVYAAGEKPMDGISHTVLAQKMEESGLPEEVFVAEDEQSLHKILHHIPLKGGDAIVCFGAGDITDMAKNLAAHHHH